jgi:hypothetical protein
VNESLPYLERTKGILRGIECLEDQRTSQEGSRVFMQREEGDKQNAGGRGFLSQGKALLRSTYTICNFDRSFSYT